MSEYPKWTGTYHTKFQGVLMRRRILFKVPVGLFEFLNDDVDPLTLWLTDTEWVRPFRRFDKMDFGSVPIILQGVVSPLASPRGFPLHDGSYEFHAVWTPKGMKEVTRKEADDMMYIGMRADGCDKYTANKAWTAVRAGGGACWERDHLTLQNLRREMQAHMTPQGT
jgi:hypothetical protein